MGGGSGAGVGAEWPAVLLVVGPTGRFSRLVYDERYLNASSQRGEYPHFPPGAPAVSFVLNVCVRLALGVLS